MQENFPFGQPVTKVEQQNKSPKEFFILGVYASAVHAKWIGVDGKIKVKAMAVASEPDIFWKGNREQGTKILSKIKLPGGIGRLEMAEERFNGPSGITLDEYYLTPLAATRQDAWLCDLLPYARLNDSQQKAIEREYEPLREAYDLPVVTLPKVPNRFCNENRIKEIVQELQQSKARKIILLGDLPIKEFIHAFAPQYRRLSDFKEYGRWHNITIEGGNYQILPLVHPRQAGRLGKANGHWYDTHRNWIDKLEVAI